MKHYLNNQDWLTFESQHVWHPYAPLHGAMPVYAVQKAQGVKLYLHDGCELIDGMSSWWCVIHGYNNPILTQAAKSQLDEMSHVMFGGLTHRPAAELAARLVTITPKGLDKVFLCDSGSVSVEVAIKMAIQYWFAKGKEAKQKLVSIRGGYHGDTAGAMAVCDPVTGMHQLFHHVLAKHFFADAPVSRSDDEWKDSDISGLKSLLEKHHDEIAALILEPIVQGAGGMKFYAPEFLRQARVLCDRFNILLIADEIATGFGRTGALFACDHAGISPDIMCVGKALTGGYLSLAATLTTEDVSQTISLNPPHAFMHGPTFMGNPLACSVANASIDLLLDSPWQKRVENIASAFATYLTPSRQWPGVKDVRFLGGIGVIELEKPVDMAAITRRFVAKGVWIRPFGKLVYVMPSYIINEQELAELLSGMTSAVAEELEHSCNAN